MHLSNDNTPPSFVQQLTSSKQSVTNTFLLVASMATLILFSGSLTAQPLWQPNGSDIVYTQREYVGINATTPQKALHIVTEHSSNVGQTTHGGIRLTNKLFPVPPINGPKDVSEWDIEPKFGGANDYLQFGPPSKMVMALADTGNVGIGTTTPDQPLHIAGVEAPIIKLQDDQGALHQSWLIGEGVHGGGDLGFKEVDNNTGDNVLFDISGNLGIGTTNPDDKLDVNGAARIGSDNWNCVLCGEGDIQDDSPLDGKGFVATPWVYARAIEGNRRGSGATLITLGRGAGKSSTDRDHIGFFTRGNNRMLIYPDGDVGIGTEDVSGGTNGFKFAVDGDMIAEEIWTDLSQDWDTVFSASYERMTYKEKERYFEKHHHLPKVSPGDQMTSKGMNMGKTIGGTIKNVEENALDIIALYKKAEKHKQRSKRLENRVAKLEKKVRKLERKNKKLKKSLNEIEELKNDMKQLKSKVNETH